MLKSVGGLSAIVFCQQSNARLGHKPLLYLLAFLYTFTMSLLMLFHVGEICIWILTFGLNRGLARLKANACFFCWDNAPTSTPAAATCLLAFTLNWTFTLLSSISPKDGCESRDCSSCSHLFIELAYNTFRTLGARVVGWRPHLTFVWKMEEHCELM